MPSIFNKFEFVLLLHGIVSSISKTCVFSDNSSSTDAAITLARLRSAEAIGS